jgi:Fur family zinc uptake transcriptional regulator
MTKQRQLEWLLNQLFKRGLRVTQQRKKMLELVLRSKRPLTAMEIYESMEKLFNGLSLGTIYQNIKLFQKIQLIEPFILADEIRYRIMDKEHPKYYVTCMDCEKSTPVDFEPEQLVLPLPRQFHLVSYKLDVYGYCPECDALKERMAAADDPV